MQLSHTGSEEMLGKIKKSWGKLRDVMGQLNHNSYILYKKTQ